MSVEDRRISVDISAELYDRFSKQVPYGTRSQIYKKVTEAVVELFERRGPIAVGYLCAGYFDIKLKNDDEINSIEEAQREQTR